METKVPDTIKDKGKVRTTITGVIVVAYLVVPLIYAIVVEYSGKFDISLFSSMFNSWLETFKYVIVTVTTFYFVNKQN